MRHLKSSNQLTFARTESNSILAWLQLSIDPTHHDLLVASSNRLRAHRAVGLICRVIVYIRHVSPIVDPKHKLSFEISRFPIRETCIVRQRSIWTPGEIQTANIGRVSRRSQNLTYRRKIIFDTASSLTANPRDRRKQLKKLTIGLAHSTFTLVLSVGVGCRTSVSDQCGKSLAQRIASEKNRVFGTSSCQGRVSELRLCGYRAGQIWAKAELRWSSPLYLKARCVAITIAVTWIFRAQRPEACNG